ncbi:MAG: hypothetical protein JW902_19325 [Syntrophaceae bacterium]|nr:hypothetical protein [Syntrophaceae bacterium]
MEQAKGTTLIHRIQYLQEKTTAEKRQQVLDLLNPEFQKAIRRGLHAIHWYPFAWYVELLTVMDAVIGKGDYQLAVDIGYYAGMKAGTGLYKLFFKFGTIKFILQRAASFWSQMFNTGSCETQIPDEKQGKMYVRNFPGLPKVVCMSLLGWSRAVIELAGGKNIHMIITRWPDEEDPTLELSGTWD